MVPGQAWGDLHLLSLCVSFRLRQERKRRQKRGAGKPRFENPKEVTGCDGIGLNIKKKKRNRFQQSKQNSSSAKCTLALSSPTVLALFVGSGFMLYAKRKDDPNPPSHYRGAGIPLLTSPSVLQLLYQHPSLSYNAFVHAMAG